MFKSEAFNGVVEMERSTLSPRASRLFTLSSIYNANSALLSNVEADNFDAKVKMAIAFWDEAAKHIREWQLVKNRKITSGDVRRDYIHSHAVVLQAIGYVGNTLLKNGTKNWKAKIKKIVKWIVLKMNAKIQKN